MSLKLLRASLLLLLTILVPFAAATDLPKYLQVTDPALRPVLKQFDFPESARFYISQAELRDAIYEAYQGKDFYTHQAHFQRGDGD